MSEYMDGGTLEDFFAQQTCRTGVAYRAPNDLVLAWAQDCEYIHVCVCVCVGSRKWIHTLSTAPCTDSHIHHTALVASNALLKTSLLHVCQDRYFLYNCITTTHAHTDTYLKYTQRYLLYAFNTTEQTPHTHTHTHTHEHHRSGSSLVLPTQLQARHHPPRRQAGKPPDRPRDEAETWWLQSESCKVPWHGGLQDDGTHRHFAWVVIYICIHIYEYIYVYVSMYVCMYVCVCVYYLSLLHRCFPQVAMCLCVYMCVCVRVCVFADVHIHTHSHFLCVFMSVYVCAHVYI